MTVPDSLRRIVRGVEKGAVVAVILAMVLLPVVEILSRWILHQGIPGSLLYTQHLTLWMGFLGALLATAAGKHLHLATGNLIQRPALKQASAIVASSLAVSVCALLAYASWKIVAIDIPVRHLLPGGVPEWWSEAVMPCAMGLTALRFAWRSSEGWGGRLLALGLGALICATGILVKDPASLVLPGILVLLAGLFLGAPVFVVMAGLAMLLFFKDGTPISSVPTETFRLVASPTLPAIPLLTAAGYVLAEGGASKRLLRLAHALIGWAPGALAIVIVLVLAGFNTFTGGSGVTILALGGLVLPMILTEKYPETFSLGLVTSSGSLGLLFPPSLPIILYSVVAGASLEELFIAGFLPGLLLVVATVGYALAMGLKYKVPRRPFVLKEAGSALWAAKWELIIPLMVVAAIFTGFATMVEAAALAALAAIVSQCFIFKDLHWRKDLPATLARSGTLVGAVLILLGVAMGLTSYLVDAEIPAAVMAWTKLHIHSPVVFLLALNAVLLVLGSVLEIYAAIIILAPLLAPMAVAYGIDPLHLGIVFLANLELGFLFPPMGLNLILASTRFNRPLSRLYKATLPFLIIQILVVLMVTYMPGMTTGFLDFVKARRAPHAEVAAPAPEAP
ncbi:MAG TPA: TRAP transporter large permease subunit [Holophagaceae bacterium]|nr:TRAP transporter large permease subunit [Holophagaceae bacterium]